MKTSPAEAKFFYAFEDKEDESREMAPEPLCLQFLWGGAERGRGQGCSRTCHTWLSLNNFGPIFSACLFLSADGNGLLINPKQLETIPWT